LRLYSQIQVKTEPVPGDECGLGFNIFTSETGFRALSMTSYVLRLVCSNGLILAEKGDAWKPLPHYRVSATDMKGYLEEKLDVVRDSWSHLPAVLKRSASAPLGEGMGEEILRRARPALDATAARRLSTALKQENLTVYEAANEVTSAAKTLGVSARLQLETLGGDVMMRHAD
jgi:hypothetical protein